MQQANEKECHCLKSKVRIHGKQESYPTSSEERVGFSDRLCRTHFKNYKQQDWAFVS